MMVFLQSHCEQKSTKTSCKEVLEVSVRGGKAERYSRWTDKWGNGRCAERS